MLSFPSGKRKRKKKRREEFGHFNLFRLPRRNESSDADDFSIKSDWFNLVPVTGTTGPRTTTRLCSVCARGCLSHIYPEMQRLCGQQSASELSVCHRWRSAGGHGKWPDLPAWPDATCSAPPPRHAVRGYLFPTGLWQQQRTWRTPLRHFIFVRAVSALYCCKLHVFFRCCLTF